MSAVAPLTSPEKLDGDEIERGIRPQSLSDFTGQPQVIENLDVFIRAAKTRGEALDHVLLYGPPGLGKTTLANIVSKEMGVNFRATSGPLLTKAGDLAAILTNLQANDVLFIDEIHRLNAAVESNVRNPYSAVGQQFVLMRRNAYASKTKRDDVAMRKIIHTAAPHVAG